MYVGSLNDISAIESFKRECTVMAKLQSNGIAHPNIVQMVCCCWTSNLMLMLEYHPLGSLREVMNILVENPIFFGEGVDWTRSSFSGVIQIAIQC